MNAETINTGMDPLEQADAEAVLRHAFDGEPLDPEVDRRIRERAEIIIERIRRTHGVIDDATFCALLNDDE